MNRAISFLLRAGVFTSIAVVIVGLALTFVHHPDYVASHTALRQLTDPRGDYPHGIDEVLRETRAGSGQGLAMLGLLLLIATPVARVGFSIYAFVKERDGLYVAITTIVLLLLVTSFILGAAA